MNRDEARVAAVIHRTPWLRSVLEALRDAGPESAWIAAGAVRNAFWDALGGRESEGPVGDVDVVYFEASAAAERDAEWRARLASRLAAYSWEVTNQAVVHRWHEHRLGLSVSPYPSIEAAMAEWPETATAVGARLDSKGALSLLAPLGFHDLVSGVVRRNPRCRDGAAFHSRLLQKRWLERWPHLTVVSGG